MPVTIINRENSLATCLRLALVRLSEFQLMATDPSEVRRHYWEMFCGLPQGRS